MPPSSRSPPERQVSLRSQEHQPWRFDQFHLHTTTCKLHTLHSRSSAALSSLAGAAPAPTNHREQRQLPGRRNGTQRFVSDGRRRGRGEGDFEAIPSSVLGLIVAPSPCAPFKERPAKGVFLFLFSLKTDSHPSTVTFVSQLLLFHVVLYDGVMFCMSLPPLGGSS